MKSIFTCRCKLLLTTALSGSLLVAGAAAAQSTPPSQSSSAQPAGGEVIVTAQKRAQRLKDVPISIAVVGAQQLQQQRVQTLDDLQAVVPGLAIDKSRGFQRISIDGVSNQFGGASTIGIYVNEASATVGAGAQLNLATMDLARVEVLRGPQGTLYGDGSLGGTVRYVTNSPNLHNYQFIADVSGSGTIGSSDPSESFSPTINIPLIDGQLALRVAALFDHDGGWVNDPTNNLKNINYTNRADVRSELLWQPTDKLKVQAMVIDHRLYGTTDTGMINDDTYQPIAPEKGPVYQTDNYDLYNLEASYDFGFATLHSSTTYYNYGQIEPNQIVNPINGPTSGPHSEPTLDVVLDPQVQSYHDISEEVRLTSNPGSPLIWDVGYFYERQRSFSNYVNFYEQGVPILFDYFTTTNLELNSYFGNIGYKFFNRLTLSAGVRYYTDNQQSLNGFDRLASYNGYQTRKDTSIDPRFDATFAVTDDVNIYASAAEGFRSGGFNGSAGLPGVSLPGFNPETNWRYEGGVKGNFFDGTLNANVSGFYSSYQNYIVLGITNVPAIGPLDIFTNGGDAQIEGLEWDFNWRPNPDWVVTFNGEYLHTAFTKVKPHTEHLVGEPIDEISPVTANISVTRNFKVMDRPAYVMATVQSRAPETYINHEAGGSNPFYGAASPWYVSHSSQITVLNLRANIEVNDHLSVGVFGDNLTNDRGALDALRILEAVAYERPMSFGIDAHVSY